MIRYLGGHNNTWLLYRFADIDCLSRLEVTALGSKDDNDKIVIKPGCMQFWSADPEQVNES